MTRKLNAVVLAASAIALLSLAALMPAGAGAKRNPCKVRKEHKGCELRKGSNYTGALNGGIVTVLSRGDRFNVALRDIQHGRFIANSICGNITATIRKTPRVGKRYKFSATSTNAASIYNFTGKLKFKSAKRVKVAGTISAVTKARPHARQCQYGFVKSIKRRKQITR